MLRKTAGKVKRFLRRELRVLRGKDDPDWVPGLPPGFEPERLEMLCRRWQDSPPGNAAYVHLSGWKESGAYRVMVSCGQNRRWQMIFKDAYYRAEHVPALADFPVKAGPPEYTVYSHTSEPIDPYLPKIFAAEELEAGCHYRYWMEDLSRDYVVRPGVKTVPVITAALPKLHAALRAWGQESDLPGFLRYDGEFSRRLDEYARKALTTYAEWYPGERVERVLAEWDQLELVHRNPSFDPEAGLQPIHGDLNLRNVVFSRAQEGVFKLIDWEWAGWGRPHADLAVVLKHLPSETAENALALYAGLETGLSLDEHRQRLAWETLERALFDASFMAVQIVEAPPTTRMDVHRFVNASLQQMQDSLAVLAGRAVEEG